MHPLKIRKTQKHPQFRKKQKRLLGKFLAYPIQVTGSTYEGIVFQTMYSSKIYVAT